MSFITKIFDKVAGKAIDLAHGSIVPGVFIVHHDVSFSDILKSDNGIIDAKQEQCNSLAFRNQGTSNVKINGSTILAPGESKEYSAQDESNLTNTFSWSFVITGATNNALVITRGKRIASYVTVATLRAS